MVKIIYWYECRSKKKAKDHFEKDLSELLNNAVFGKIIENVSKHTDIKLVTTGKWRNNFFFWKSIINRNGKNSNIHE